MTKVPYVHSGYDRKENDDYQTVDGRCVQALVDSLRGSPVWLAKNHAIVDMCGSHGSGIIRALATQGYAKVWAAKEAFERHETDWIITNPPYDRAIVDKYARHALKQIEEGEVYGAAFLMRANWDMARSRAPLFESPFYHGQIRMRFRPWWSEDRKAQPIHNYVWHIWYVEQHMNTLENEDRIARPQIYYWPLAADMHKLKTT